MPSGDSADAPTPEKAGVFCDLRDSPVVVMRNDLAFAPRDASPVTPLHTLILPLRHTPTYFDLTDQEIAAANDLLRRLRAAILAADSAVQGFNIGANVDAVSGETIFHCHIHLIPRRAGDLHDPRGGVRGSSPTGCGIEPRRRYARRLRAGRHANGEANFAAFPSSASISSRRLYLAMRSLRHAEPVFNSPPPIATAKSARKASSVSPERCERK